MHCNPKILSNISRKAIASFPRSTNCALGNIHTIVVPVGIKQQTVSKKTAPKFCCPTPVSDGLPLVLCMKLIKGAFLFTQFIPATNGGFNKTTSISLKSEGTNDKISFVKLVLNFMQEENLIFFDEERRIISITTRFKSIVYFYFEYSKENKNRLLEYVYELGGNENATY